MARVEIKNLGRLQAKLAKLDPLTRGAVIRGVNLAALAVEGSAKHRAPVDTGALRRSISVSSTLSGGGAEAQIGSSLEYAPYVELGTSKQKPQPYLRPALQSNKSKARKLIITEIVKAHKGL